MLRRGQGAVEIGAGSSSRRQSLRLALAIVLVVSGAVRCGGESGSRASADGGDATAGDARDRDVTFDALESAQGESAPPLDAADAGGADATLFDAGDADGRMDGAGPEATGCEGGTLFAPVSFAGGSALRVRLADMNRDGHLDIVSCQDGFKVALGQGDGTFLPPVEVPWARAPGTTNGVDVGDVNGDGLLDVVVSGEATVVAVFLARADGSFESPASYPFGYYSGSVALGDLDGDGALDIVMAVDVGVAVLLNRGDGTFGAAHFGRVMGGDPQGDVSIADLNGDGALDVAMQAEELGAVGVFLNDGHGKLGPVSTFAVGTGAQQTQLAVADVTGDGIPDVEAPHGNQLALLVGRGDGTFAPARQLHVGYPVTGVAVGDFNGDGLPDLAPIWGLDGSGAVILLGTGAGGFRHQGAYYALAPPGPAAVGDVNEDGLVDLVVAQGVGDDGLLIATGCEPPVLVDAAADAQSE